MSVILYACSTNAGKLREFSLAAGSGYQIDPLPGLPRIPAPEENGVTFEENASTKSAYYSNFASELVFADDSGLEVPSLDNAPGVYSARFAGPDATDLANNEMLLKKLAGVNDRSARFVCVVALARSGQVLQTFRGWVEGTLLHAPRGLNGFGYDPLFFYPPMQRSFAELGADEKFAVSHRGKALRKMLSWIDLHPRP